MAIVKMKQLRLIAMTQDRESLLRQLQRAGCVEISEPETGQLDQGWEGLTRPDGTALAQARERQQILTRAMEILKRYAPEKTSFLAPKPAITEQALMDPESYAQAMEEAETLTRGERSLAAIEAERTKTETLRQTLAPWLELDVPLEIRSTGDTVFQFGCLPLNLPIEQAQAAAGELAQLLPGGADRTGQYAFLICHSQAADQALAALKELGWSRVTFRDMEGTALDNDRRLDRRLKELEEERAAQEEKLAAMGACWSDLRRAASHTQVDVRREEGKSRLLDTETTFLLEGWVPAERWPKLEQELERWPCAVQAEDPDPEEYPQVPVQLKNNWFTRPLNMVTEMYSLPAYGSLDPNPLMAPFFILFYGIMMADMGFGLLMMLASVVVLKKKRPSGTMGHFFGLLGLCGVSTFIMGALTGGFFGDFLTQLFKLIDPNSTFELPALFTPLNDTMMILVGAMALGFVQIITGMAISFAKKLREGQVMDAVWEELTWWIVFLGLGLYLGKGFWPVLAVGGVMVLVGAGWNAKGFGKVTAVFGSLYNHITGYFGDILSYSRLMALMLAGSVIAQVFNTLGAIPGNIVIFIIISAAGNALNFALNLLGCYVHDLRLQCLEYFNKFYQDGGKPFRPLDLSTNYYDVVN